MPYHPSYYRPPRIYVETQALRRRDALRMVERQSRREQQKIGEVIEEHGERMSDEGRGLLLGLAETLRKIGAALGGK